MILLNLDLILYLIICLCTAVNTAMFWLYWAKVGDTSYIFKAFTFLMLGMFAQNFGSLIAVVHKRMGNQEMVWDLITSWWWPWRLVITAVCCVIFTVHFAWRYVHMDSRGIISYGRRHDD